MTNEVLNTMKTRRSCRCYLDKMPEPEALNAVLEAGTWAPTGMGRQSPVIVCIQNKADRDTLSKMNAAVMGGNGDPFYGAPCVAVVLVDKTIPTCVEDGSLVMGNMLNAAESVGLSACWIHRAKEMFETAEGQALLKKWGVPNAENLRGAGVAFGGAGLRRFLVGEQLAVLHRHAVQPLPAGNLGGIIQQRFVRSVTKAGEQNNQLFLVLHHFTSTT